MSFFNDWWHLDRCSGVIHITRRIVGWYCTPDQACVAAPVDAEVPMRLSQMAGIAEGRRAR